jgi:hypothetical protein
MTFGPIAHGNAAFDLFHDLEVYRPLVRLGDYEGVVHYCAY